MPNTELLRRTTLGALRIGTACLLTSVAPQALVAQEAQAPDLMVVFDASGSMWGQVDGVAKIEIAREVFSDLSQDWAGSDQAVGLIAYGHRRKGDCADIEVLERPSVGAAQSLAHRVQGLVPRGKTPLSQAVRMAAEELKFTENAATVVLLSDGIETCDLDPCAVGTELERLGVNFTAHVIGFDIQSEADKAQLQCLAENTGGRYLDARDAGSLSDALSSVTRADAAADPLGVVPVHVLLKVAEGSVRPAAVTLTATHAETGEVVELGRLEGADQVLTGVTPTLSPGPWTFRAEGDGGAGTIDVDLTADTETIFVPFTAAQGDFAIIGTTRFPTDETATVQVKALSPLQQNATFRVTLLPSGATEYSQNITWSYRFGSDPVITEHNFYLWQYSLPAGAYDVIVLPSDSDDLSENLGRASITLTDPGAGRVDVTLSAVSSDGSAVAGPVFWSLIPEGANGDLAQSSQGGSAVFEGLEPGTYDVTALVHMPTGQAKGAAQIVVAEGGAAEFVVTFDPPKQPVTMDQIKEPLSPGVTDALQIAGDFDDGAQVVFIGLDGQATVRVPAAPLVSIPAELEGGVYRAHLIQTSGEDIFLDTLDILPASAQGVGDHSSAMGEDANTMMSAEERAAESGPQTPFFEIWKQCDGPQPCRIEDRRVSLEWLLPPVWATSEPFYYSTAGGATADKPTVEMARLDRGEFNVVLNPRQWDAQLGPCEQIAQGTLCRDETEVALDLKDYDLIKRGLAGEMPKPDGWLPVGRSWTMMERALDNPFGLVKIDEPAERAETTTGMISITSALLLGVQDPTPVSVTFDVGWDNAPLITDLFGRFEIDGEPYDIRLARPGDWDGATNVWRGELSKSNAFLSVPIELF